MRIRKVEKDGVHKMQQFTLKIRKPYFFDGSNYTTGTLAAR